MKKILVILSLLLLITGCGKGKKTTSDPNQKNATTSSNNSLGTSFYRMVNFGNAEYRKKFYDAITTTQDFEKIGRQLQLLSTKHYSTDKYYLAEGNILSKDNVYQLLRRSDDPNKYPNTIQPKKGTSIEGVNNPIMVSTIYEQD